MGVTTRMTTDSAIRQIKDEILALQASDYNTYDRPLKRLARILTSEHLRSITDSLKNGLEFDAFLADSNTGGSMMGSASLNWPDDPEKELGLTLILIERAAEDPRWFLDLAFTYYHGGSRFIESIRKITSSVIEPFGRDFERYLTENRPDKTITRTESIDSKRVFVVHGHDEASRELVARFISNLGLQPVILHEQANRGGSVLDKLIENSDVGYAIVLLTPDDFGRAQPESEEEPRARQNVILELGYFLAELGRERVLALRKGQVEIPSDYMGVLYVTFDESGAWKQELYREMRAVGFDIDWNSAMG